MSDAEENETPAVPPPKRSKLFLVGALLCLANLGYGGYALYKGAKKSPGAAEGEHSEKDKEKEKEKAQPPSVAMEPIVVNLNEPDSSRYLKTTIEIDFTSAAALDDFTRNKRGVRDQLLRYLSSLTVADTLGEVGKTKIQEGVTNRIEKEIGAKHVKRLFYAEFVVQ